MSPITLQKHTAARPSGSFTQTGARQFPLTRIQQKTSFDYSKVAAKKRLLADVYTTRPRSGGLNVCHAAVYVKACSPSTKQTNIGTV